MRMLYKVDENQEEVALKKLGGVALGKWSTWRPPSLSLTGLL